MDFKQIQDLIKIVSKSNLTELKVEQDNFKITIRKENPAVISGPPAPPIYETRQIAPAPEQAQAPAGEAAASKTEKPAAAANGEDKYVTIKSPMIGTFYRSPSPEKDAFVKVGDVINKGDHICIIEAMKLFNEIEAEMGGKIIKVLAEDATPVEYDQPLFLIDPTGV